MNIQPLIDSFLKQEIQIQGLLIFFMIACIGFILAIGAFLLTTMQEYIFDVKQELNEIPKILEDAKNENIELKNPNLA